VSNWVTTTVRELVENQIIERPMDGNHGSIHPKSSDYVEDGIPFIMASDISNGKIDFTNCAKITKEQALKLRKGFSKSGDVLLTHKGTLGLTAIVPNLKTDFIILTPQVTYYRVIDRTKLNNRYLYYYFQTPYFQQSLKNWAGSGSTRAYIGITDQLNLSITLPPINVQEKISEILGSLDDKIELNRRMNETLEQMAMALYKHWFVEFGPFQDEEFVESEIGNIPTCLGLTTIGKAVKVIGGGTPSTKVSEYWENGEINWFTPTDLTSSKTLFITKSTKRITEKGLNESSAKLFPAYSVMMTSRATIGVIAINREPASTNQGFIVLIPNEKFPTFYLYLWLKNNLGSIHSISNGSTFLEVNRSNFKELPIIESDKVLEFNKLVEPIFSQIEALTIESETLTQTRDFLLPRLLSGEIEVREAEEQVEEVLTNA